MRLIVIGASGFIGNAVYRAARLKNIPVVGTSSSARKSFYRYDLASDEPEILSKLLTSTRYDAVCAVIAAGKTNIDFCFEHRDLSARINVVGMKKLLGYLFERDIKTLYLSSDAVFDGRSGNYNESSVANPLSVYGIQKLTIERFIQEQAPGNLILRLPKIIDSTVEGNHLFAELYRKYKNNEPLRCIKGLMFNPTYVGDIAECVIAGLMKNLSGLYHVANPQVYSRFKLTKEFIGVRDSNYPIEEAEIDAWNFLEPKPLNTTLSTEKFRAAIGNMRFTTAGAVIKTFWDST